MVHHLLGYSHIFIFKEFFIHHGEAQMFFELINSTELFLNAQIIIASRKSIPFEILALPYEELFQKLYGIFIKHLEQEFYLASFFKMFNYSLSFIQTEPYIFKFIIKITGKPNYFLDFPMDYDSFGFIGDELETSSITYQIIMDLKQKCLYFEVLDIFEEFQTLYIWRKN